MIKHLKINMILLVLTGLMLSSCEKEFKIDATNGDNLIVINSLFNANEPLSLSLTKSMLPQDNQNIVELKNAKVALFKDGTFLESMHYIKQPDELIGRFYSNTKPVFGSTYKVEVEDSKLGKASTQSLLPDKVDIISDTALWVKWEKEEDSSFVIRFYFEIDFIDPANENFYYITASVPVYKVDTLNNTRTFESWQYAEILSGDLPAHEIYLYNALLFKDITFNNSKKKISGTATMKNAPYASSYKDDKSYILDKSKLHIELHSLSKDAFNYCSSYSKKIASQDDVYSEPTVVYSNIINGLGIFAGESISKTEVVIQY
jgi:hypothetical protein